MKNNMITRLFTGLTLAAVMVSGPGISALAKENTEISEVKNEQSLPGNPVTEDGIVTWDCVYFGDYWQGDTNKDGKADKSDTKQPIKWRVLSVDASGNALLLSDKNIEIEKYNTSGDSVTWETCTLRSFLNSYDSEHNDCEEDYEEDGFLTNAFNISERAAIKVTNVVNSDNPIYGTEGGNDTKDKVFLLSLDEAMNSEYGFITNNLRQAYYVDEYSTDADETRVAVNTEYVDDKTGYNGNDADTADIWWLRTPGASETQASRFHFMGAVTATGSKVYDNGVAVRPALYLNLSSDVWESAGTVSSVIDEEVVKKAMSDDAEEGVVTTEAVTDAAEAKNDNDLLVPTNKGKVWTLDITKDRDFTLDASINGVSSNDITVNLELKKGTKIKLAGYDKKLSKQFKKDNKLSKKTGTITSKGVLKVKKKEGKGELKYANKDGAVVTVKYTVVKS